MTNKPTKIDIFDAYSVDQKAAVEGVWVTTSKGMKIKLAFGNGAINKKLSKKLNQLMSPHQKEISSANEEESEELFKSFMLQAYAEEVIKDWEPIEFKKAPLPYSVENAVMLMNMPLFAEEIIGLAQKQSNFSEVSAEKQAKN